MASNYDDVIGQLQSAGLIVSSLDVGKMVRVCTDDSPREKRGWYKLHELTLDDGEQVLVGAFGVWRSDDNGALKVELRKREISPEQRAAIKARFAEDRKRAEAERQAQADRAAAHAQRAWAKLPTAGESDYLARKGIGAHGVRFTEHGAVVVPMMSADGKIHGLQFVLSKAGHAKRIAKTGRDKEFWPTGLIKKGHFHIFGGSPDVAQILLIAEGYATAASLHEATGLPVAVAFDAGNLQPVAQALHKRYKRARILICADDDIFGKCVDDKTAKGCGARFVLPEAPESCPACGKAHGRINAGVVRSSEAALAVGGAFVAPKFSDEQEQARRLKWIESGGKLSDYNDLHLLESLRTVGAQIEGRLAELGWTAAAPAAPERKQQGGGERSATAEITPIQTSEELLERFALIYGHNSTCFDSKERILLKLSDVRDACTHKEISRRWMESPDRKIVRITEVGFDPTEKDTRIKCNLFGGWEMKPSAEADPESRCGNLLGLLYHLCGHEAARQNEVFNWVLDWIAYPLQNPGAKMKTAVVFHGPQGTGKNLFFESYARIYGTYGRVIGQSAIEDKHNDWASKKLFIIADEVVAREELFHNKNMLKGLITGDTIRINPKNVTAYEEKNHCNLVFLSNEDRPLILEKDDRRYTVIHTPAKLPEHYYKAVQQEIDGGGIEALHAVLMQRDLSNFKAWTLPVMTEAKENLIDLSLDSPDRFFAAWLAGEIDGIPAMPCESEDLYLAYRTWCGRVGIPRYAPLHVLIGKINRRQDVMKERTTVITSKGKKQLQAVIPAICAQPEGTSKSNWLGSEFEAFAAMVADYKGGAHD